MFCFNSIPDYRLATIFCTCHESIAVAACAKFCSDHTVSIWLKAKRDLRCDNRQWDGPQARLSHWLYTTMDNPSTSNVINIHVFSDHADGKPMYQCTDMGSITLYCEPGWSTIITLQWRHDERGGVWNRWCLDCLLKPFVQIKENTKKITHYWPLWGKFTGDRWIHRTKGQ